MLRKSCMKIKLVIVMALWGSLGVFSRSIELSSVAMSFYRAMFALPILLLAMKRQKVTLASLWVKQMIPMAVSGVLIGGAWVLFFVGFRLTSVANVTLLYNLCPMYVMLLSPWVLKTKNRWIQWVTILVSFVGMIMIVFQSLHLPDSEGLGLFVATLSGFIYAVIVLINRKYSVDFPGVSVAFVQLVFAGLVLLPLVLFQRESLGSINLVISLILLGVVHTGIAYIWYFDSYKVFNAATIAQVTYLDPLFSIIFACFIAFEPLSLVQMFGGILILGSSFVGLRLKQV